MKGWIKKTVIESSPGGPPYMTRWVLDLGWFGALRLHHIHRADDDLEHHDHPFSFLSLVVKGWYWEELGGGRRTIRRGRFSLAYRNAGCAHRISHVSPGGCWTALWTTPKQSRSEWGFYTDSGWVHWKVFCRDRGYHLSD
jgi:hypothetical protein